MSRRFPRSFEIGQGRRKTESAIKKRRRGKFLRKRREVKRKNEKKGEEDSKETEKFNDVIRKMVARSGNEKLTFVPKLWVFGPILVLWTVTRPSLAQDWPIKQCQSCGRIRFFTPSTFVHEIVEINLRNSRYQSTLISFQKRRQSLTNK